MIGLHQYYLMRHANERVVGVQNVWNWERRDSGLECQILEVGEGGFAETWACQSVVAHVDQRVEHDADIVVGYTNQSRACNTGLLAYPNTTE
jgi:hypothetical protein